VKLRSVKIFRLLPLALGVVVFLGMTTLLGEVSEDIINHEPLTIADVKLSNWLHVNGNAGLTTAMLATTSLGSTIGVSCIAIAFGIYLIRKRRFSWLVTLAAAILGGSLLNRLLKYFFHRRRPHFDDPILTLTSYSFPSGHTMMATVLFGVMAAYCLTKTTSWSARVMIIAAAGLLVLLVGFSRIYLGAHYLSDVIGALAEGLAWLSLCLTLLYSLGHPRQ
jgi:membrane-associated phospholipid phosphatase